ncbi:RHS repeat domain-containing protein [Crossiella sp. CA198]|uniref:RHS repeat domain-containing protein n=1 Tax=Crossiella sp. CA198 TaxID=3455607 RepID=UPI003F8D17DE
MSAIMSTVVLVTTAQALPAVAAPAPVRFTPGQVDRQTPVVPVQADRGARHRQKSEPPRISWPAKDSARVLGSSAKAEVLDRGRGAALGVDGLVLAVTGSGPAEVQLDYAGFRDSFGGDWAQRLRLAELPACAANTPERAECRTRTPVPSRNDPATGRVTARIAPSAPSTVYALEAAPEGATGDYKATPMAPSGDWQVAAHSGNFSWNYPFRVPPVPGDLAPKLALGYSSGSVDGRVAGVNNQPGWAGEGWDFWPGHISRSFKACAQDSTVASQKTGDQCWAGGHHLSFVNGGRSGELVWSEADKFWRSASDDGSRFELKQGESYPGGDKFGEYWELTTTDGTRYQFGAVKDAQSVWTVPVFGNQAGEPCHTGDFATSHCERAWRWNLDRVIDRHGNTISYTYEKETNAYGLNMGKAKGSYTRGGTLRRVDYGQREGVAGPAAAQVLLDHADRCAPGTDCNQRNAASYPDVPWDLQCDTAACTKSYAPSYFSAKRLAKLSTQVWDGAKYLPVDSWQFQHSYPRPGDSTRGSLWLDSIVHTGLAGGSIALPAVEFAGEFRENRVDTAGDGKPELKKQRITSIRNEHGGETTIGYKAAECVPGALPKPEENAQRCFPVHWAHDGGIAKDDWFHKYVVDHVSLVDRVGGAPAQETHYDYQGGGAWAYQDNELIPQERRTWAQWRGYHTVLVREGSAQVPASQRPEKELRYFRGLHGDRLNPGGGAKQVSLPDTENRNLEDATALAGFQRGEIVRDGLNGPVVTDTVTDAEIRRTATAHNRTAYFTGESRSLVKTTVSQGIRRTEKKTRYDQHNLHQEVAELGDVTTAADDRCVRTSYARDEGARLLNLVSRTETVAVACDAPVQRPDQVVSDQRTHYDGKPWGQPPVRGDVTRTERATSFPGGQPKYEQQTRATHDGYGRVLQSFDALDRRTSNAYQPETGPTRTTVVTNPLGHTSTTELRPEWGSVASTVDTNELRTSQTYDALGRVTAVWKPGRTPGRDEPHLRYTYQLRGRDGVSAVSTQTLRGSGDYVVEHQLFDGQLRPRQTQTQAWTGDRVVTEHSYDSRGLQVRESKPFHAKGTPGIDLVQSLKETPPPGQVFTEFDGARRSTASTLRTPVDERRTVTRHRGDRTEVIPPTGDTTTATITDAHGRITELHQFHGPQPDGAKDITRYTYSIRGELETVTDSAGNRPLRTVHDLVGNRIEAHDPDKGVSRMTYDNAGLMRTKTDSRGQLLVYGYDDLNRPTEIRAGSATGTLLAKWEYDATPRAGGKMVRGQPSAEIRYAGGQTYRSSILAYDEGYRPVRTEVALPPAETGLPASYTTVSSFNPDGSLAALTLPKIGDLPAETLVYRYDSMGLLRTMSSAAGNYVRQTEYTAYGELAELRQGPDSAVVSQRSFYEEGTRVVARTLVEREIGNRLVDDTRYTRDQAGNVKKISSQAADGLDTQCFSHDHLRRMTQAWTPAGECGTGPSGSLGGPAPYRVGLSYDASGNRRTETRYGAAPGTDTVRGYDYPATGALQPHAVRSVTTTAPGGQPKVEDYRYTPTGGTESRPGVHGGRQQLGWDAEDRLTEVKEGDRTTSHVYSLGGQRLLTRDPGGRTLHLPHGELRYDETSKTLRGTRYYSNGKERTIAVRTEGKLSYQALDHQGTATLTVDATTHQETRRRLDAFGTPRQATTLPGNRGFVGGTEDKSTGLTRLGVRDYDPGTGRFLSVDPLLAPQDPQSLNGFAYANNNPATLNDANGLRATMCAVMDDGFPGEPCYEEKSGEEYQRRITERRNQLKTPGKCGPPRVCFGDYKLKFCGLGAMREIWQSCPAARRSDKEVAAERRAEDARRRAAEEAERRKTMTYTVAVCESYTVSIVFVSYTTETCNLTDAEGTGKSSSSKFGFGPGFGASKTDSIKHTNGRIGVGNQSSWGVDGSLGQLGPIGVEGGISRPTSGNELGDLTVGGGLSQGLGTPRVTIGYEYGTTWRT